MDKAPGARGQNAGASGGSEGIVGTYMAEISQVDLLSFEDELALGREIELAGEALECLAAGDVTEAEESRLWGLVAAGRQASRRMAEANLRLVVSVAKRFLYSGLSIEDLVQEGNIGLLKAVSRYDYHRHLRFSTYATYWIRQSIGRAVAENGHMVRLPAHVADRVSLLKRTLSGMQQRLGREPTLDELTLEAGELSEAERRAISAALAAGESTSRHLEKRWQRARANVRDALASIREPLSLDSPLGDSDEGAALEEILATASTSAPDIEVLDHVMGEQVTAVLGDLPEREQRVLRHRFGLGGASEKTLEELGAELGVTRERVRQIEARALSRIRLVTVQPEHTR